MDKAEVVGMARVERVKVRKMVESVSEARSEAVEVEARIRAEVRSVSSIRRRAEMESGEVKGTSTALPLLSSFSLASSVGGSCEY